MERDTRRARGQWRGCYEFDGIICDGDGRNNSKRKGGLKMGATYYYYYELDGGAEIHDNSIPSTTSCPYLPGQPVNLLCVPVEVKPLRFRSASMSSVASEDIKTMNPADKFMTPRPPPPPPPVLQRLNTSPPALAKTRSTRSVSPKSGKSTWSPRAFFGLRSQASSPVGDIDNRGRSSSFSRVQEIDSHLGHLAHADRSDDAKSAKAVPTPFEASQLSFTRSRSREPSPLRKVVTKDSSSTYNTSTLIIPDEIEEEAEDDDNFASQLSRISRNSRNILTPLSPPPSALRSPPPRLQTATDTSKPLPQLPEVTLSLVPRPLRLRAAISAAELPRSHFSTSTISTTLTSPTESHFGFSETPSISDSNEDEDLVADFGSGDELTFHPMHADCEADGFSGYSLPDGEYASEQTLRKETPLSALTQTASRATFGGAVSFAPGEGHLVGHMSALADLMHEMGYLGDVIIRK